MVLSVVTTGGSQCATIFVAGPFTSVSDGCNTSKVSTASGDCSGACIDPDPWYDFDADAVHQQGLERGCYLGHAVGDPGNHSLLVGLNPGSIYLVAIQTDGNSMDFCIGVNEPASNAYPNSSSATPIDACGTAFSNSTGGGHWISTCTSGGYQGGDADCDGTDEINFVVNNISWFYFCPSASGTWNISLAVTSCNFTGINAGAQIVILKDAAGGSNDLTLVEQSSSSCGASGNAQVPPGCTWTSSDFTVNAGDCIYIGSDGFAGDVCNYTVTVNNVSGGCVLPIELLSFKGEDRDDGVLLSWQTATDKNISSYTVEWKIPSMNNFVDIGNIPSQQTMRGNTYSFFHKSPHKGYNFYRLMATSVDGERDYAHSTVAVYVNDKTPPSVKIENGKLNIEGIDDDVEVNVFNNIGQLIASFKCRGTCSYELGNLAQGTIYYVRIYSKHKEIFKSPVLVE